MAVAVTVTVRVTVTVTAVVAVTVAATVTVTPLGRQRTRSSEIGLLARWLANVAARLDKHLGRGGPGISAA